MQSPDLQKTTDLPNQAFLFPSLIILLCLIFQGGTTFKLWCSPDALSFLPKIKVACDPALYPFLTYPMYSTTHQVGKQVPKYVLFGILEDSTEILIIPADFGFYFDNSGYWMFEKRIINPILNDDQQEINDFIDFYEFRNRVKLSSIRLENHPVSLIKKGYAKQPNKVLKEIKGN